jgi:hypothetical protein
MNIVGRRTCAAVSAVGVTLGALALAAPAAAQQPDMKEMMKWASVTVVHYDVVGEFQGETIVMSVPGGASESGQVTDRVEFAFDWHQANMAFAGEPKITNFASKLGAMKAIPTCPAAKPAGPFEFWTVLGLKPAPGGAIELSVRTDFAGGQIPVVCGSSWKAVPAVSETEPEEWGVLQATLLAMPLPPTGAVTKSKDGKSLITRKGDWTWTFTPRPVK